MLSELSGPGALAGATRAGYREAERRSGTPIRTLPQPATLMPGVRHHDRRLAPASKKRPITPQWEHVLSGPRDATLWLATPYGHIEIPVCYDAADGWGLPAIEYGYHAHRRLLPGLQRHPPVRPERSVP